MKYSTYNFNAEDFPRMSVQLLVEVLAFQQSILNAVLEEFADAKQDKILARINQILPDNKERVLEALYSGFGKTPDLP